LDAGAPAELGRDGQQMSCGLCLVLTRELGHPCRYDRQQFTQSISGFPEREPAQLRRQLRHAAHLG
jgi:hypothetical protein